MRLFEKTPEAMTGSRIAAVDYAKTLAIVCVVMIHVSSEVLLGRQIGSAAWLEGLFWSSLARGAVPLFLMCSGVLFLDRSGGLSVRRIWKRNIPHILLALLVWAAVYKLVPRFLHEKLTAEALRTILLELLCGQHEGHLYFLHIMLLVYAALPVTYTFAANADEKTERYALAFWIVSGVLLPTAKGLGLLHAFSGIFLQWPLMLAWAAIGCTWLGHFLMNRDPLSRCIWRPQCSSLDFSSALPVRGSDLSGQESCPRSCWRGCRRGRASSRQASFRCVCGSGKRNTGSWRAWQRRCPAARSACIWRICWSCAH